MALRSRLAACAAVALVVLVVLAGCAAHPMVAGSRVEVSPSAPSVSPSHHDFVAIRRLAAARAAAVLHGDEAAFLATVDPTNRSFYDAQRVMFENLQALPVTSMSFEVGDAGLTNAPGITGGPLLSPEVVEHVGFAGTDRAPVANEVAETFVKRSGGWLLAADRTDSSQTGGDTARPWAGPRIAVVTRGHLIVVADATRPGAATDLANTVETDLRFDAGILDVPVDDHLMVDATSSGSVTKFDNRESAAAVTFGVSAGRDFRQTSLAGLRVKVNPTYISVLDRDPVLLRHELTHYLMFRYSGANPTWLTEGLAEYVSHQPAGLRSEYMTPSTYQRLMNRPRVLTTSGLYGQDPDTDYPLAMACVTYLVDHGGVARLERLMSTYASYADAPYEDEHTAEALGKVYGLTPGQVAHGAFGLLAALQ